VIGRCELSLATRRTTLFLENPCLGALFVVQVLALELDNLVQVLYLELANRAKLDFVFVVVDSAPAIHLVERDILLVFVNLVKYSSVLLEPSLCCFLSHHVHGRESAHRRHTFPACPRMVNRIIRQLKTALTGHLEQRPTLVHVRQAVVRRRVLRDRRREFGTACPRR